MSVTLECGFRQCLLLQLIGTFSAAWLQFETSYELLMGGVDHFVKEITWWKRERQSQKEIIFKIYPMRCTMCDL